MKGGEKEGIGRRMFRSKSLCRIICRQISIKSRREIRSRSRKRSRSKIRCSFSLVVFGNYSSFSHIK